MKFIDRSWYYAVAAANNNGAKWNIKRKLMHNVTALTRIVAFMSLGRMSSIRWRWCQVVGSQSPDYTGTKNQLDLVINLRPILNRFVFSSASNFMCDRWCWAGSVCVVRVFGRRSPDHARGLAQLGHKCKFYIVYFLLSIGENGAENLLDVYIMEPNR